MARTLAAWLAALLAAAVALAPVWTVWLPQWEIMATFAGPAAIAGAIAAMAAALAGAPRAGLAIALAAAIAGSWTYRAPLPPPTERALHMRLAFQNVWVRNRDPAAFEAWVRQKRPEVIALAEVTGPWIALADRLRPLYPHQASGFPWGERILILSRLPMAESREVEPGGAKLALAEIHLAGGCSITIAATHLSRPWPISRSGAQTREAAEIAAALARIEGPLALVGDFNAAPWQPSIAAMAAAAALTPAAGAGGTWPSPAPALARLPIDHVFTGRGARAEAQQSLPQIGSDHRGVIARVRLDRARCVAPDAHRTQPTE